MSFAWAIDGQMVRRFDPYLYDDTFQWIGPKLPEEDGLPFGDYESTKPAMMALVERLTGYRLTETVLADTASRMAVGLHPG
jgi:hypothetical protein